ncbi:hypothetical protein BGZ68_005299 [Mortierella alpina]|nr:hypothetical protein BGZ68_005299 [Mortierella alpina]
MALEVILMLIDDPAMKSLIEQEDMIKVPFLRIVDLMESRTSDETVSTETRMLSEVVIDAAGILTFAFGW